MERHCAVCCLKIQFADGDHFFFVDQAHGDGFNFLVRATVVGEDVDLYSYATEQFYALAAIVLGFYGVGAAHGFA